MARVFTWLYFKDILGSLLVCLYIILCDYMMIQQWSCTRVVVRVWCKREYWPLKYTKNYGRKYQLKKLGAKKQYYLLMRIYFFIRWNNFPIYLCPHLQKSLASEPLMFKGTTYSEGALNLRENESETNVDIVLSRNLSYHIFLMCHTRLARKKRKKWDEM